MSCLRVFWQPRLVPYPSECNGGIIEPHDQCAVRFKFQCTAGSNAAIVSPGIGYWVDFRNVVALGEYRYYGGRGNGISVLLKVAHNNNPLTVLLNGRNDMLVHVDEDYVDNGSDGW